MEEAVKAVHRDRSIRALVLIGDDRTWPRLDVRAAIRKVGKLLGHVHACGSGAAASGVPVLHRNAPIALPCGPHSVVCCTALSASHVPGEPLAWPAVRRAMTYESLAEPLLLLYGGAEFRPAVPALRPAAS
mgnify:CR=1 FL=1